MDAGYSYRLLLDESVEHELIGRPADAGHDVEHVDFVQELGKGAADPAIGRYSLDHDRFVVTYDEDFVTELGDSDHRATLFVEDATMVPGDVARAIATMAEHYPPDEIRGVVVVGREWLIE